jgi:hypothetical protein
MRKAYFVILDDNDTAHIESTQIDADMAENGSHYKEIYVDKHMICDSEISAHRRLKLVREELGI